MEDRDFAAEQESIDAVAAKMSDPDVAAYIIENARVHQRGGMYLYPPELGTEMRRKLDAELGETQPTGYMSEECYWSLDAYLDDEDEDENEA